MSKLRQKFDEFHANNPHVYERFVVLARQWKDRGYRRCGANMLLHILRYESGLDVTRNTIYKINQNYSPYYARLLEDSDPSEFAGFFEKRCLRAG